MLFMIWVHSVAIPATTPAWASSTFTPIVNMNAAMTIPTRKNIFFMRSSLLRHKFEAGLLRSIFGIEVIRPVGDAAHTQPFRDPLCAVHFADLADASAHLWTTYAHERQRDRPESDIEESASVRRSLVILALGHGARNHLDLPCIDSQHLVVHAHRLARGLRVGKKEFVGAGLDQYVFERGIEDVRPVLRGKHQRRIRLPQRLRPIANELLEEFMLQKDPRFIEHN